MANNSYEQPINKHVDWAGDASTGNKPVAGEYVQQFIKESLDSKIGCIKYFKVQEGTAYKNYYYGFADNESYEAYLEYTKDPDNVNYVGREKLVLARFEAPAPYSISITLDPENSIKSGVPILYGSTGNSIVFGYKVVDSAGETVDNTIGTATYSIYYNGTLKGTYTETYPDNTSCSYSIDSYLTQPGSYSVSVNLAITSLGVESNAEVQFDVVRLSLTNDAFSYYTPVSGKGAKKYLNYKCRAVGIDGYANEIEIFIDGEKREELTIGGSNDTTRIGSSEISISKALDITYLWNEPVFKTKHNIQARLCSHFGTGSTRYYSSTLYFDFVICPNGQDATTSELYELLLRCEIPTTSSKVGVIVDTTRDEMTLNYNQFVKSYIYYTLCDSSLINSKLSIKIDDEEYTSIASLSKNEEHEFAYQPMLGGKQHMFITASKNTTDVTPTIHIILDVIENATLNVREFGVESGTLELRLTGKNKSNDSTNPGVWEYQNLYNNGSPKYSTTFNGVNFNSVSGWHDNALVLTQGATIDINISPFDLIKTSGNKVINGMTFEIEFETYDIKGAQNEIINIMNYNDGQSGACIKINSDSAEFSSNAKTNVKTNYKDSERIKLAFIVNPVASSTAPHLMYIVNNGVLERAKSFDELDGFTFKSSPSNPSKVTIGNPDGKCTVKIYNIRVYSTALTPNDELENFLYDYDINKLYDKAKKNDILDTNGAVSYEKIKDKIPVMIFKGSYSEMRDFSTKKMSKLFNIEYHNPNDPKYDFKAERVYVTKQGTSSIKYPVPNFRLYLEKNNDVKTGTRFQYTGVDGENGTWYTLQSEEHIHPQTGERVNGKLEYSLRDGSLPTKWFTIKADYAESSMTHNTGIARWFNDLYKSTTYKIDGEDKFVLRTNAQNAVAEYSNLYGYKDPIDETKFHTYDVRTCVDGIPMCVFVKDTFNKETGTDRGLDYNGDDLVPMYIGTYIFNTDKKSKDIFGFKDIKVPELDDKGERQYDANGKLIEKKIFENHDVICWEGSANEEAIAKGLSVKFDDGASVNYDASTVDKRNIFNSVETRYPDEDDYERTGLIISGNLFNNTASYESMIRFLNFCKPAVDIKIGKKNVTFNPNDKNTYYDGYNYTAWAVASIADIRAAQRGEKLLYIMINDPSDGKANMYEEVAIEKIINDGSKIYYVADENIDYNNVIKVASSKQIGRQIYFGTIKNWQYKAMEKLLTEKVYNPSSNSPVSLNNDDLEYIGDYFEDNINGYGNSNAVSHDVRVIVEYNSTQGKYTYVDGFGRTVEYPGSADSLEIPKNFRTTDTYMKFFNDHFEEYFKTYQIAAYYSYVRRFNAVDQVVKNTMWTTEDNQHFYLMHYDNDTIIGVRNDAALIFGWDCNRSTYDHELKAWAYAGFDAVLWNNIECSDTLMNVVRNIDNALTTAKGEYMQLTYNNACHWFDDMQCNSWSERMYNYSEKFKYIDSYIENISNKAYLLFLQGNRTSHRHWWLRHRFDLVDAEWMTGEYSTFYIGWNAAGLKQGEELCRIIPATDFYFGYKTNEVIRESGIYVRAGEEHIFRAAADLNVGDPVRLMGPYEIDTLDFSHSPALKGNVCLDGDGKAGNYIKTRGSKMRRLLIGSPAPITTSGKVNVTSLSFINDLSLLEELDITNVIQSEASSVTINNLANLRIFKAKGSNITIFNPSEDAKFDVVELPDDMINISLNNVKFTSQSTLNYIPNATLTSLIIKDCQFANPNDSFNIVRSWIAAIKRDNPQNMKNYQLTLTGINWSNLSNDPTFVDTILALLDINANVSGTINFGALSFTDYSKLVRARKNDNDPDNTEYGYGPDCFNDNGDLKFEARPNHYIFSILPDNKIVDYTVPRNINAGKSIKFDGQLFPLSSARDYYFRLFTYNVSSGEYILVTNNSAPGRCEEYQNNGTWYTSYIIDTDAPINENTGKQPRIILNNYTGELISEECETGCELYVGMSFMSNRNNRIKEAYPIKLTIDGVTLPKRIKLTLDDNDILTSTGSITNQPAAVVFDDADDKILNINYSSDDSYNKSDTDADIKNVTATYVTTHAGTIDIYNSYVHISKIDGKDQLRLELTDIPTDVNGQNYNTVKVKVKIEFDSTLANRFMEFEIEVHVLNITPTYFSLHRFECIDPNGGSFPFEGEWSDLIPSGNAYTTVIGDITYSVVDCMADASNEVARTNIVNNGFALRDSGKYKIFVKYYTSFGKNTTSTKITSLKAYVDDLVVGAPSGVLFLCDGYTIDTLGNIETYPFISRNESNPLYIDTTVSKDWFYVVFDPGTMTYVKDLQSSISLEPRTSNGSSESVLYRLNSESSNKYWIPINSIAPNDIQLTVAPVENNVINIETFIPYKSSKIITLNYDLSVAEGYGVDNSNINTKYEIVLGDAVKQPGSYDITKSNLLSIVNNDNNGFTINIDKLDDSWETPGREHPLVYKCNLKLIKKSFQAGDIIVANNDIVINAIYSYSSASTKEELKDVNANNSGTTTKSIYYLVDNDNEYWEVDDLVNMRSTNWDTYHDNNKRLVGCGFKIKPVGQIKDVYVFMCIDSQYSELLAKSMQEDNGQYLFHDDPTIFDVLHEIAPNTITELNQYQGILDNAANYDTESNVDILLNKTKVLHDYLVNNGNITYRLGGVDREYNAYKFGEMYSNSKLACYVPSTIQLVKLLEHADDINKLLLNYGVSYKGSKLLINKANNSTYRYRSCTNVPATDYKQATLIVYFSDGNIIAMPAFTQGRNFNIPFIYVN